MSRHLETNVLSEAFLYRYSTGATTTALFGTAVLSAICKRDKLQRVRDVILRSERIPHEIDLLFINAAVVGVPGCAPGRISPQVFETCAAACYAIPPYTRWLSILSFPCKRPSKRPSLNQGTVQHHYAPINY